MGKDLFDLDGKIALVTGASRGIGESIARTLAAYGAHVIVSSRKIEGCQAVADAIRADGGSAEAYPCHIGDPEQIAAIWQHIDETHGRIDILVNNAATNPHFGPVAETPPSMFDKTVDVNIRGYFFMSAEGVKRMIKSGGGSIINTASVNGINPGLMQGIYSITKAAVISMTKTFAKEYGAQGVRVNALLPGLTETKFAGALFSNPQLVERYIQNIPLRRHAQPDEMAGAVLYLASDAASYTTGSCITVDGGMLIA